MRLQSSSPLAGTDAGDLDLVPGEPPVPITVWRTPAADTDTDPLIPASLVRQLVAAYTQSGQRLLDLTGGLFTGNAEGREIVSGAPGPGRPAARSLAMIAVRWPIPETGETGPQQAAAQLCGTARSWLGDGGFLALLAGNPPGLPPVDYGPFVAAAAGAGLGYLQHIAAIRTPVDGDRITAPAQPADHRFGGALSPVVVHAGVHADVFVFAARAGASRA